MTWTVSFTRSARKQLSKLSPVDRARVLKFLQERIVPHPDPRGLAKRLQGKTGELWRFRVGDLRIIVQISEGLMTIVAIELGHRREIYR
ncbi:type II toxin-antitoxin system RelE family toxin [Hoeflea ulvae]|uniref:Type II toxin-antitoxin system RelE/ParE family toxin n=1 Tax=Hoeflea ulvae TaxID=2983764 RepID=A0ABT3YJI8_9HYPH|nr:type II toxin-antitoxin system RelE/ParE family toxin [Hoeflea ulvae]MCY0096069.1 type II toxin-antitoxin system RelE/ParE family toxin [Hoeflea ulvae]